MERMDADDFREALDAGIDLVKEELKLGERDGDLLLLVARAAGHLVCKPDASLDDVIREYYSVGDNVRAWWDNWS